MHGTQIFLSEQSVLFTKMYAAYEKNYVTVTYDVECVQFSLLVRFRLMQSVGLYRLLLDHDIIFYF